MIEVQHVTKQYGGDTVVDDVSFQVKEQETLMLLGTSGSGKTTTLRMLNRLIEPSAGQVFIHGKDIKEQQPEILRRGIGYVLQRNSLFPHYTVLENISVVPELLHWNKQKIRTRAEELMQKLDLPLKLLDTYPRQLSGGQAQRVNLARALVADPPVLLMDEPFSALDTLTRKSIRQQFLELDELKKKTVVMVTHDVQEAFEMGDRICLMDKGRIIQQGLPEELLFTPANDFVRSFFADSFIPLALMSTRLKEKITDWAGLLSAFSEHQKQSHE